MQWLTDSRIHYSLIQQLLTEWLGTVLTDQDLVMSKADAVSAIIISAPCNDYFITSERNATRENWGIYNTEWEALELSGGSGLIVSTVIPGLLNITIFLPLGQWFSTISDMY